MELIEKYKSLFVEYNNTNPKDLVVIPETILSDDQSRALEMFKKGESISIIASAGAGKSFLIKEIFKYSKEHDLNTHIYITSTTGVSAYSINGITINSFSGIGTGESTIQNIIIKVKKNKATTERIRKTNVLVIDEISMMSAEIFEKLNTLFQVLRGSRKLFGGVQLVLSFDLLQLQPVFKDPSQDTRLIFESETYNKFFNKKKKNIIILQKSFRQENDIIFKDMLNEIRLGIVTENTLELLEQRKIEKHNVTEELIELVPTNRQANEINTWKLNKLKSTLYTFEATVKKTNFNKQIEDILERELITQLKSKNAFILDLKIGAKVMLIKNLEVTCGLVNGSTGTIKNITNNDIQIAFDNGLTTFIKREEFKLEMDGCTVTVLQYPLILAYSLTLHKIQSLTLEKAILDLAKCFCVHQVYVGLSRLRSLNGLYIRSFDKTKVTVDPKCIEWINQNK